MPRPTIVFEITPSAGNLPPMVFCVAGSEALTANTDEALVARTALTAMAYLFTQGQPVEFGHEIPRELLK
jgi:hypothetical protein